MNIFKRPVRSTTQIGLGDLVRDQVTGFEGIAIAITIWLHSCERVSVQPRDLKDGKVPDCITFDIHQLSLVKSGVIPTFEVRLEQAPYEAPGGEGDPLPQRETPKR